jgi:hypothetical protein
LGEHLPYKQGVAGSSPAPPTHPTKSAGAVGTGMTTSSGIPTAAECVRLRANKGTRFRGPPLSDSFARNRFRLRETYIELPMHWLGPKRGTQGSALPVLNVPLNVGSFS